MNFTANRIDIEYVLNTIPLQMRIQIGRQDKTRLIQEIYHVELTSNPVHRNEENLMFN